MSESETRQIMSRLSDDDFIGREVELARVCALVQNIHAGSAHSTASNALLLGAPRAGKTEILRKSFDRLFNENSEALPFYYRFSRACLDPERFARDYFSHCLAQFVAFRRNDPTLIAAVDEQPGGLNRAAPAKDYLCVRSLGDSFARLLKTGDAAALVRFALSAPAIAASHAGLKPLVMVDDSHLLADTRIRADFIRALGSDGAGSLRRPAYVLTGLRRLVVNLIPPDQEAFDGIELIPVERIGNEAAEKLTRRLADLLRIEASDSTIELIVEQLNCDFFYIRSILNAAASRGVSLKTFFEFERLYTNEILRGAIGHYLDELLRDIAPLAPDGRAVLEALSLVVSGDSVPIDVVIERMREHKSDTESLLARLHARELLNVSYGFVAATGDQVLADYVGAKYRSELAGAPRPVAGDELLGEKLKHSYKLMMTRYNRAIELQLIELLSHFDFQSIPLSLFDHIAYDKCYRGMSRVQVRRALDDDQARVRLPQIAFIHDLGSGEQPGVTWRLFSATGFQGGIYTDANEVHWQVALINSREPLDVETLGGIDQRLESALRGSRAKSGAVPQSIRWYISKEGFSALASERIAGSQAYRSTYAYLDLIQDYLTRLSLNRQARPASEFELVIPINDEAELIAARTAEHIARAADFDQESINQIKTALIEACINAAEHGESPDGKIHQRFAIDEDKLIITVSNKGKPFGKANGQATPTLSPQPEISARGRGLKIISALMDEVEFERTDDGARLVMTKYLKSPSSK